MTTEEYARYVQIVVHRVLFRHRPHERCGECPPETPDNSEDEL
jgi:hypothetical protein